MVANQQTNEPELNIVQPTLALKMVHIMGAVGNVAKDGRNKFQNYDFIQSDDVLKAVRAEMVKNNVIVLPRMLGYEMTAETKGFHAVVQFEFTLIDADSGETISATWYGEASDSSDKSFSKAGTSALKYWLLKTFMISAGEPDADAEGIEHEHQERSSQSKLRGHGQQQRRIPPKSNQDAPNSSAVSNEGTGQPDTQEWTANAVIVRKDQNNKPYLVYLCNEGKPTGRGRDLLRQAGYECEEWTVEGETYNLTPAALVTVQKNGQFWNVMSLKVAEVAF